MLKLLLFIVLSLPAFSEAASSRDERAKHDYQATLQAGFEHNMVLTQFMFSKFLGRDDLIGLKFAEGEQDQEGEEKAYQTNFAIQYKHFFGNSFYIAPEIYYLNYFENDKTPTLLDSENERLTSMGISVRIGNQWQWSNFTLGCDWIGTGRDLVWWNRDEDILSTRLTLVLLNFYLGLSF